MHLIKMPLPVTVTVSRLGDGVGREPVAVKVELAAVCGAVNSGTRPTPTTTRFGSPADRFADS